MAIKLENLAQLLSSQPQTQKIPTPSQIVSYLNRYVRGQEAAKRAISLALYTHLLYLSCRNNPHLVEESGIGNRSHFASQPLLLIGATGSGKSYLLQRATEYLQLPCSFVSATSLVQTGYVGLSIDKMMEAHYFRCQNNVKRAERAIIFIDEIDKVKSHSEVGEADVSGEGVQNALLTLFDGKTVTVNETRHSDSSVKVDLDPSGILFICAGSFAAGLPALIRERLGLRGFPANPVSDAEILAQVQTEDLMKFGFIPEFIGRFGHLVALDPLNAEDLVAILVESEDSIVQKHKTLFALHGIELVFSPKALQTIARRALNLQTGARGLTRIVRDSLLDLEYQLPELAAGEVTQITVDEYTLWEGQATFQYQGKTKKQASLQTKAQQRLREELTIVDDSPSHQATVAVDGKTFTKTQGWTDSQIKEKIEAVKQQIGYAETTDSARKWWEAFETENRSRLPLILRLVEELLWRKATITEFFLAYVYSNIDNIQANLHYLDYTRLKQEEERRKKAGQQPKTAEE